MTPSDNLCHFLYPGDNLCHNLDFSLSEAIKRSEIVQQVIGTILAAAIIAVVLTVLCFPEANSPPELKRVSSKRLQNFPAPHYLVIFIKHRKLPGRDGQLRFLK